MFADDIAFCDKTREETQEIQHRSANIFSALSFGAPLLSLRQVQASGPSPQRVCFFVGCASAWHLSVALGCSEPFSLSGHSTECRPQEFSVGAEIKIRIMKINNIDILGRC